VWLFWAGWGFRRWFLPGLNNSEGKLHPSKSLFALDPTFWMVEVGSPIDEILNDLFRFVQAVGQIGECFFGIGLPNITIPVEVGEDLVLSGLWDVDHWQHADILSLPSVALLA